MMDEDEVPFTRLTPGLRIICILTIFLLVASALGETIMFLYSWFFDEAYSQLVQGYISYAPVLKEYAIPTRGYVYLGTFFLACLNELPYYAAMLIAAFLFLNFYKGKVWWYGNVVLLRSVAILFIVDGVSPYILGPLQILLFTFSQHPLVNIYVGFTSDGVRVLIIGFTLLVFCWVLAEARYLFEENEYILKKDSQRKA
ncbi:hypothetical protein [Erwinia tasmaniensis]|uniref:hypothetical protein n=1 Tax=Erwinia tasmaniensis TaxID=338565 RepID=UPI003A4D6755